MVRIIFESKEYFDAIYEIQSQIRNKMKYGNMTNEAYDMLEWVSSLILDELNDRKLEHYWNTEA